MSIEESVGELEKEVESFSQKNLAWKLQHMPQLKGLVEKKERCKEMISSYNKICSETVNPLSIPEISNDDDLQMIIDEIYQIKAQIQNSNPSLDELILFKQKLDLNLQSIQNYRSSKNAEIIYVG